MIFFSFNTFLCYNIFLQPSHPTMPPSYLAPPLKMENDFYEPCRGVIEMRTESATQ